MPEESTTPDLAELVARLFEFVTRREWETVLSMCTPDAVWDMSPLGLGSFQGPDAIRGLWEEWASAFEEWEIELDYLIDHGNGVSLVVNRQGGRPRGSSGRVGTRGAWVYEWTDGRIARATIYGDIDEARAAARRLAEERG